MCIDPLDDASSGVYIHPGAISEDQADIEVETLVYSLFVPVLQTTSKELLSPKGKKGQGLYAEYFSNADFKGKPRHTRIDKKIDFRYGNGSPFDDMESDNFSAIWTGRFVPEKTGLYKFILNSDDGSILVLNGSSITGEIILPRRNGVKYVYRSDRNCPLKSSIMNTAAEQQ